ncbi:MAG: MIP/aquaporin family protein [Anaerolineales bacterium]
MEPKKLVAEFVGTFALIFIGAGAGAISGSLVAVAFAHGLVIVAFAYAYGHISGTHINPAVTFGVWLSGNMSLRDAVGYWIVQLLGGASGAGMLFVVLGGADTGLGATVLAAGVTPFQGILVEAILTFFLVNSVLHAAVSGKAGNMAGLAIGMTLTLSILMGGKLTGASLNPARTFGPAIYTGTLNQFWIYLVGTLLGAAVAAVLYRYVLRTD